MLPRITSNRRYEWLVGFYVNLSTLSRGNLTINVQKIGRYLLQHEYVCGPKRQRSPLEE